MFPAKARLSPRRTAQSVPVRADVPSHADQEPQQSDREGEEYPHEGIDEVKGRPRVLCDLL
jgi:hypothetical protein